METIYVVTQGHYSDYSIRGVFSTKEKAQEFIVFAEKTENIKWNDKYEIEEHLINEFQTYIQRIEKGYKYYDVYIDIDGNSRIYDKTKNIHYYELDECKVYKNSHNKKELCFNIWAKSEQHAVKIANEKRAQIVANNEWDKYSEE